MSKFISYRYKDMLPYVPGEQPQDKAYIKLNTNESPFEPSPEAKKVLSDGNMKSLNLYPDPDSKALVKAIAERFGIEENNVAVSNGSDEMLAFCFMAFCDDKTGVAFPDISYGFYKVFADLFCLSYEAIPLKEDFSIDADDYKNKKKTIFIANPNAPTGLSLSNREIEEILSSNKDNIVVIDEAYADFSDSSAIELINKYDNLIVVRTFSKSVNLAGGRVGYAIACKELVEDINKMKYSFNPYNVNTMSGAVATAAIKDKSYFDECVAKVKSAREYTIKELRDLGFSVLESKANFVFAKKDGLSGKKMYEDLKSRGILIRRFDSERIKEYLRITIGSMEQMKKFIEVIKEIVEESI